ncbi:18.0 kDa class I heat shock protein-like [Asparagus officinalis]|uniref:18.0 kDa class I heat shock protein-like n=1 Tax=Asparagus officinalis TaxID=4686 RepID=UPI00098E34E7|nr:18.0 kDa class I heat shock protein-like [Asparagus officinalis]
MSIIPSFLGRKANKINDLEPVSLEILDPFEGFSFAIGAPVVSFATTRMDWKETPDAHVFIAEVPGLRKEEVKIEVEEGKVLKISGQRTKEFEDKNEKWHRVERISDKFVRSVRLPPNANTDKVRANLENGVLTVTVPKGFEKVQGGRFIQISG